jgi:hypothetical protein
VLFGELTRRFSYSGIVQEFNIINALPVNEKRPHVLTQKYNYIVIPF